MPETITYTGTLVVEECWCGIQHAVPQSLVDEQRRQFNRGQQQTPIYCPLGHPWIRSGESETERERKRRERAEARETALRDQLEGRRALRPSLQGPGDQAPEPRGRRRVPVLHPHLPEPAAPHGQPAPDLRGEVRCLSA